MAKSENISMSVIKRLPRYYRFLGELEKHNITRISSRELSQRMGLTASQIRQDLNCFGGFGQQGYGYNVEQLYAEIGRILGVDRGLKTILIGAGNLGRAIATHMSFEARGFNLIGIFDKNGGHGGPTRARSACAPCRWVRRLLPGSKTYGGGAVHFKRQRAGDHRAACQARH